MYVYIHRSGEKVSDTLQQNNILILIILVLNLHLSENNIVITRSDNVNWLLYLRIDRRRIENNSMNVEFKMIRTEQSIYILMLSDEFIFTRLQYWDRYIKQSYVRHY